MTTPIQFRQGRGRPSKTSLLPTLSHMGITRDESSEWQKLAAVPEWIFEAALALARETNQISRGNAGIWRCINAIADSIEAQMREDAEKE